MHFPSSFSVALELGTLAQSTHQVEEAPCLFTAGVPVTPKAGVELVQGLRSAAPRLSGFR